MTLLELFKEAEKKHSKPVIEFPFLHKDEQNRNTVFAKHKIRISLAAKRLQENFPNYLYITLWAGNHELTYLGKITKKGEVYFSNAATPRHKDIVAKIYTNPVGALAEIGRQTGICCFCSRILTQGDSIKVGYGPICAEKYGLPWGV